VFAESLGVVSKRSRGENVMIVEDEVKIMDFGLAKVLTTGTGVTESVTVAGMAMGTLGYMAPEVLTGGAVDERADLFAVGVMIVETLVGARPFTHASVDYLTVRSSKRTIPPPWGK
jgi:eukaryotic-like serine/threonine-protein kinase